MFSFKQFSILDDKSTMKVGTDAVLIGSLAHTYSTPPLRILDIGTGCGVIALMLAQRFPSSTIEALDIDPDSINQASINFSNSPWATRLSTITTPIQQHKSPRPYDLIVSNPPYFENSLKTPQVQRNLARHNDTLPFHELAAAISRLLGKDGTFVCILPCEGATKLIAHCESNHLFCYRKIHIHNRPSSPAIRTIAYLSIQSAATTIEDHVAIRNEDNSYSEWYKQITEPFYTHLK